MHSLTHVNCSTFLFLSLLSRSFGHFLRCTHGGWGRRSGQAKVPLEIPLPETVEQLKVDICDYSSVQSTVDDIGSAGGIDFLINNAATLKKHPANTFDMAAFQKIQRVNVEALFPRDYE